MARIADLHKKWRKEPKYRKAYGAIEEKFVPASAVVDVRNRAGLTQEDLARISFEPREAKRPIG